MSWLRSALLGFVLCGLAHGHVVSISNGELRVSGRTADYELRMPAYEIEHVDSPETTLLDEIRFGDGHRASSQCSREGENFVCHAHYQFDHEVPDTLEVECTLYRVTVPNHIHMLYATQGENGDQRVFDQSTPLRELRFHPPSVYESLTRDGAAGALRFLKSISGLLFVALIGLAARSTREAALLGALFVLAECAVRPLAPFIPLSLSAEFLEAVMALTVAYLAGEILFLPEGRARWLVIPTLGMVHGLPFVAFPPTFLAGAVIVQAPLLGICSFAAIRASQRSRRLAAVAAMLAALVWFAGIVLR